MLHESTVLAIHQMDDQMDAQMADLQGIFLLE